MKSSFWRLKIFVKDLFLQEFCENVLFRNEKFCEGSFKVFKVLSKQILDMYI